MSELDEKLNSVLSNPQLMQQIMAMAQSLGSGHPEPEELPKQDPPPSSLPNPDPAMLQRIAGMAQSTGVDRNQRALLAALGPYLSRDRVGKLEKAMRAAKMAALASSFLNAGGLRAGNGR